MKTDFKYAFERVKSTDFPIECRGMYYFAKGRHEHQIRKFTKKPYYTHPRGVAYIVLMVGGTIDQINAAFAHDLLEDTETSFTEIAVVSNSYHCAELCSELRNNRYTIEKMMKKQNYEMIDILDVALSSLHVNDKDISKEKVAEEMGMKFPKGIFCGITRNYGNDYCVAMMDGNNLDTYGFPKETGLSYSASCMGTCYLSK